MNETSTGSAASCKSAASPVNAIEKRSANEGHAGFDAELLHRAVLGAAAAAVVDLATPLTPMQAARVAARPTLSSWLSRVDEATRAPPMVRARAA